MQYAWSGLQMVSETSDSHPDAAVQYIYPENSYEPLARVDSHGEHADIFWYHTELNGLPDSVTDSNGDTVWRGASSAWGHSLRESTPVNWDTPQNLRFQGQYLDRETGLHYNTFRYYDPAGACYTQMDPIGLRGGLNLYAYASNPLNWIDPLGLTCKLTNQQFKNKLKRIKNQTAAGDNQGITGVVSQNDAFRLGEVFVGPNYRVMSNGKGFVSEDGLRTFRFPADKRGFDRVNDHPWSKTGKQVNFETKNGDGDVIANVHLDVENFRI